MLVAQLQHAWTGSRRVLDDLTDEEYAWEPASPCWSIRRRSEGLRGWGSGEFVCEDAWPAPDPLPTTTIAWRVIHLAAWADVYRGFAFEGTRPDLMDFEIPGDRSGGVAWLFDAQDRFIDAVTTLDDEAIFDPVPAHWGESIPAVRMVTMMLTEHVHHLAEIGTLRDLRRGHAVALPPPTAPVDLPTWWTGQARSP